MRIALLCLILTLFCQGCEQAATRKDTSRADPAQQARQWLVTGNYQAAADEYNRLSTLYPEKAAYYRLKSAESLMRAGEPGQAQDILGRVEPVSVDDRVLRKTLLARVALMDNRPEDALSMLTTTPAAVVPAETTALWYQTKAEAYEAQPAYLQAVEQRIRLDRYLIDPVARKTNIRATWEGLNRIELPVLLGLADSAPPAMNAWAKLAIINRTMLFRQEKLKIALQGWMDKYANHPAIPVITSDIVSLSNRATMAPGHIALLLPLSGQYEKAAHAIRNGFLAAWFNDTDTGSRPQVSIYDANALNITAAYQQAVSNGADFIVGPLEKQAVKSLLTESPPGVTTLALNQIEGNDTAAGRTRAGKLPGLIQFGLSPEDEARQAAERGIFDGHNRALVVTPNNDWGRRLARAFGDSWNALGGRVLEYVSYDHRAGDFSTPVKELLNIDSSEARIRKLRQKLNRRLESEPRLRQDADMIFMAAVPFSARQIVPQFRFYRAVEIPVYATSHVFSGVVNVQADSDMNGIRFTEIPAILDPDKRVSAVQDSINRNWSADTSNFRRLYAMGIDALRLIPEIGRLALQDDAVYAGQTGDLYMTGDGRILRRLLWARMVNGKPRLLSD